MQLILCNMPCSQYIKSLLNSKNRKNQPKRLFQCHICSLIIDNIVVIYTLLRYINTES